METRGHKLGRKEGASNRKKGTEGEINKEEKKGQEIGKRGQKGK